MKSRATITGGIHATNGPKNGIAMRMPAAAAVTPTSGSPNTTLVTSAMRKYVEAHDRLAAQEPAERARDRRLEEPRLLGVGRRDEAEHEGQDLVAVDDHVDRQEEHDEHRPDDAQAGDRDLLERLDEGRAEVVEVGEEGLGLGEQVDLAEADRVEPVLPRLDDRRAGPGSRPGIEATNSVIEVARAPATRMRITSRIATTGV